MKFTTTAAALTLCLIMACTPYQPQGFAGGYTETWLAEDAVRVRFNGNGYTSAERAADFSLLRVAEIAKEKGYRYFVLLSEKSGTTSLNLPSSYQVNTFGNTATVQQVGGGTIVKPSSENTAKLLKKAPRNYPGIVYEAAFVCASVTQKHKIETSSC